MQRTSIALLVGLILCSACSAADGESEASSASAAETSQGDDDDDESEGDDAPATTIDDAESTGAADETTAATTTPDDETGTGSTGEAPLTGDVWVDANGDVIGLYRVVVDDDEDAVEGLVDGNDATWRVIGNMVIDAIDGYGVTFYESTDCTGPAYFAEPNASWGAFREGIVAAAIAPDYSATLFVVPPGAERVEITFGSWVDGLYGCLNLEIGIYDYAPTTFYAEADVLIVEPPAFVPPLAIEHH